MTQIVPGLVSTIIPVFNRPEMLRDSTDSVLAQTYRPIEVIISDDGSTDATQQVGRDYVAGYPDVVRYIRNENSGVGAAREAGRRIARGEFIQYLDSDDKLLARKFEVQVAALRAHPECSIAYGVTQLVDDSGRVLKEPFKWSGRRFDELFPALLVDRWWNTHTPLWRRSVCDAIGAWTPRSMGEDWEYEARAAALRVKLAYCSDVVSQHRHHDKARLTGADLSAATVGDFAHLVRVLWSSALQAGVDMRAPEVRHFSRWAFLVARQAAAMGLDKAAIEAFDVAASAGRAGKGRIFDLRLFRAAAGLFGWRNAERLARAVHVLRLPSSGDSMRICTLDDVTHA